MYPKIIIKYKNKTSRPHLAGVKQETHIYLKVDQHPHTHRGTKGLQSGEKVLAELGVHWEAIWLPRPPTGSECGVCAKDTEANGHLLSPPRHPAILPPEPWTGTDSLGRIPGRAAVWGLKPVCSCFSGSFGLEHLVEPIKIKKPSGWRLGMPAHFLWHGGSCLREPAGINGTQLITNSS